MGVLEAGALPLAALLRYAEVESPLVAAEREAVSLACKVLFSFCTLVRDAFSSAISTSAVVRLDCVDVRTALCDRASFTWAF